MSFTSRRLTLAVSAKAVSFFGNGLADIALVLRLQPHGATVVAGLLACNLLPIVLLSSLVGRLVDSVGERALLVVSGVAQAAVCVVLAWLADPGAVYAAVALLGAGQAVNAATWQAVVPALAPPGRLALALSRSLAATTLAGAAAPALGGLLVTVAGTVAPLLVDAATFLALAVAGVLLGDVRAAGVEAERDERAERVGGLALVRRSPVLRTTIGLLAAVVVLGSTVNVVEVFLVRTTLHSTALAFGLTGAAYSAGALAGSLWAGGLTTPAHQAQALLRSMVAIGVGLVAMGLAPTVAWLIVAAAFTGATNGTMNVATASLVLGATPSGERGRVGAMQNGLLSGAQLLAYGLSALGATVLDPRAIFVLGGVLAAVTPVLAGRRLRLATGLALQRDVLLRPDAPDPAVGTALRELTLYRVSGPR